MSKNYLWLVLFLMVLFALLIILYQKKPGGDEITVLTSNLLQAKKANNLEQMTKFARERQDILTKKLKDDPQAFLSDATLGPQKQSFPDQVKPYLEEEVQLEGKLIVVILDDFEKKQSLTQYFLEVGDKRYQLYFTSSPKALSSGSIIQVKGVLLDKNLVVKR